jgi:hypothetical protein
MTTERARETPMEEWERALDHLRIAEQLLEAALDLCLNGAPMPLDMIYEVSALRERTADLFAKALEANNQRKL